MRMKNVYVKRIAANLNVIARSARDDDHATGMTNTIKWILRRLVIFQRLSFKHFSDYLVFYFVKVMFFGINCPLIFFVYF